MPSRFHKSTEPNCDFIVRDRGPEGNREHTIEMRATFIPIEQGKQAGGTIDNGNRSAFGNALMNKLPRRGWMYDSASDPKCFRLRPEVLDQAIEIAKVYYRHVYLTEGEKITNLITGEVYEPRRLFE